MSFPQLPASSDVREWSQAAGKILRRKRCSSGSYAASQQLAGIQLFCGLHADSPDEGSLLEERRQIVNDAINRLPSDHRNVLLLRINQGLPAWKIAQKTRLATSAVHIIINESVIGLRRIIVH